MLYILYADFRKLALKLRVIMLNVIMLRVVTPYEMW